MTSNARDLVRLYDVVVDCTDRFPTRYLINDACVLERQAGRLRVDLSLRRASQRVWPDRWPVLPLPVSAKRRRQAPCRPAPRAACSARWPASSGRGRRAKRSRSSWASANRCAGRLMLIETLSARVREVRFDRDPSCARLRATVRAIDAMHRWHTIGRRRAQRFRRDRAGRSSTKRLRNAALLDVREPHEAVLGLDRRRDRNSGLAARSAHARTRQRPALHRRLPRRREVALGDGAAARRRLQPLLHLRGGLLTYAGPSPGVRVLLRRKGERLVRFKPFGRDRRSRCRSSGKARGTCPRAARALAEAGRAIRRGIELGMTHLDTAEMYGSGRAEELLGEAIAGLPRERSSSRAKCCRATRATAARSQPPMRSLRRLRLDYLDLYLLHWPGEHPLEETMRALETLVDAREDALRRRQQLRCRRDARSASYLAPRSAKRAIKCSTICTERGVEHALIPEARERGIAVVAYTPFGRGRFPRAEPREPAACSTRSPRKHGATPRQVILAFLTRETNVFAIPKASQRRARRGERGRRRSRVSMRGTWPRSTPRFRAGRAATARDAVMHGALDQANQTPCASTRRARWCGRRARRAEPSPTSESRARMRCGVRARRFRDVGLRRSAMRGVRDRSGERCSRTRAASSASRCRTRRRAARAHRCAVASRTTRGRMIITGACARARRRSRATIDEARRRAGDGDRLRYAAAGRARLRRARRLGWIGKHTNADLTLARIVRLSWVRSSRRSSCRPTPRCARPAARARAASTACPTRRAARRLYDRRDAAASRISRSAPMRSRARCGR